MRKIPHISISNITHINTTFMLRLDTNGNNMEELTKQISGTFRLEEIFKQANDTNYMYSGQNLALEDKIAREIIMLKYYMTKLECKTQEHQILDLKTRSVENNVFINGIEEKIIKSSST